MGKMKNKLSVLSVLFKGRLKTFRRPFFRLNILKNPRKRIEAAAKFPYPYLSIIYQTSGACR
jgi:hypothetical protein